MPVAGLKLEEAMQEAWEELFQLLVSLEQDPEPQVRTAALTDTLARESSHTVLNFWPIELWDNEY